MEKLIPLLIALAIFGFKSYQNYMKQQEAALKRKKATAPIPAPVKQKAPSYEVEHKKITIPTPAPFYPEETNEIQRFKKEREEQRLAALSKKTKLITVQQTERTGAEDFDLRKAIVMSVILDRPYK